MKRGAKPKYSCDYVRYSNRKLYDTKTSKYVTHSIILEAFTKNNNIVIISHKTGENITENTIVDALMQNSFNKKEVFNHFFSKKGEENV